LKDWLAAHPGAEIICRDCSGPDTEGAQAGAPDAQQGKKSLTGQCACPPGGSRVMRGPACSGRTGSGDQRDIEIPRSHPLCRRHAKGVPVDPGLGVRDETLARYLDGLYCRWRPASR
jgi:hypothetical protein